MPLELEAQHDCRKTKVEKTLHWHLWPLGSAQEGASNITGKREICFLRTNFLFVHKINGHSRLALDLLVLMQICRAYGIHALLKPIATDGAYHSCPQCMHTEYYQWDLFPCWRFMHNSSSWASMRLMLLLTCSNSYCSKQQTFSIIGHTYSIVHEMQIPFRIHTACDGMNGMSGIKWASG